MEFLVSSTLLRRLLLVILVAVPGTAFPAETGALATCGRFGANNNLGCTVRVTLTAVEVSGEENVAVMS